MQFCFLNLLNIETLFPLFFSLRTKRKILFSKIFISYQTRNFQAKLQLFNYLLYYSTYYKYRLCYLCYICLLNLFTISLLIYYNIIYY